MARRRKILFIIIILLLIVGIFCWWMLRGPKMMGADITSSNGAHYAMQLPNDLEPAHINDTVASLQYENVGRDLHIMVIDDSKAKIISFGLDYDLDTYMKIATRAIDNGGIYVNKSLTINGNAAMQTEIKAETKGKKKIYKLTCIETPKYFYQILEWTAETSMEKNKSDMDKMVMSFKEVGK